MSIQNHISYLISHKSKKLVKRVAVLLGTLVILAVIALFFSRLTHHPIAQPDSYFKFDEGYGTSSAINDSDGSVSAGTITNAAWKPEDMCHDGKCLYFDGSGDSVSLGDNFDFTGSANWTIEFWFRTPGYFFRPKNYRQ